MDITKCTGEFCPLRNECKRFTCKSNELYQSYFVCVPYTFKDNVFTCDMYLSPTVVKVIKNNFINKKK